MSQEPLLLSLGFVLSMQLISLGVRLVHFQSVVLALLSSQ